MSEKKTPQVPFSTADVCWCQPFDGPAHPNCPMHGEGKPSLLESIRATNSCVPYLQANHPTTPKPAERNAQVHPIFRGFLNGLR